MSDAAEETARVAEQVREERGSDDASPSRGPGKKRGPYKKRTGASSQKSPAPKEEREPYKATEQSLAASSLLCATVWAIAGPMVKLSPLTPDEAEQLGAAVDPILAKYVPMMDDWREELTLAVALAGAFETTRRRYREEHPEAFVKKVYVENPGATYNGDVPEAVVVP